MFDIHHSSFYEYALFDAAAQLGRFVAALSYVVNECEDDLEKYCGSVRAGQGRLAECLLDKNKDEISERCNQTIKDVDLTYEKTNIEYRMTKIQKRI